MRDNDQGAIRKLLSDGTLNQGISFHVDGRRRFIEDHDFRMGDDGTGETEELALALGEVETTFCDGEAREVKRFLFFWSEGVEVPDADGVLALVGGMSCTRSRASRSSESGVIVKGVEVGSYGAGKREQGPVE
ncbi:hypothetical protein DID88_002566 [Monilinia fructigena]|uniref:Uncharacterized protein n=1 Tax=Monilinia fructigena TaxID=38457 RepID=A0A395IP65_9HELO|nr:hypothetical protein DID88_002566 [Monilinia fructigena]